MGVLQEGSESIRLTYIFHMTDGNEVRVVGDDSTIENQDGAMFHVVTLKEKRVGEIPCPLVSYWWAEDIDSSRVLKERY